MVRKDGTGQYTQIMAAIYAATNGDVINIGPGTYKENIEFLGKSLTLQGAGKDLTIVEGKAANDTLVGTWFAGDQTITLANSTNAVVGKAISGTGITAGTRIASISGNQMMLSLASPTSGNFSKNVITYQTVQFSAAPTTGVFKLAYGATSTVNIAYNATVSTIQTALRAISGLGSVTVSGSFSAGFTVAMVGVTSPVNVLTSNSNTTGKTITISKTGAVTAGSSIVILPDTTSVAVGQKVDGVGVNATVSAWNSTTRTMTLSSPATASNDNVTLYFRLARSGISITQANNPASVPATIAMANTSDGMVIKDLCVIGFDWTSPGTEAAAISFVTASGLAPGHKNFMIDGCKIVANGDAAIMSSANPYLDGGVIQNCLFEGKTFAGSEPADVPAFSTFTVNAVIKSIGASSTIEVSSTKGIVVGSTMQSPSGAWASSATVQAINGNILTINKLVSGQVNDTISATVSNVAYVVPNVARNLVYIGQNVVGCAAKNITFKNNVINAQTGAYIASSDNKNMFNSVVTMEVINGVCEGNIILATSMVGVGAGFSNYLFRNRQAGAVIQYNVDYTNGQSLLSVYAPNGSAKENIKPSGSLVSQSQSANSAPEVQMSAGDVNILSGILNHPTFKDQTAWKMVAFIYKHESSAKRLVGAFKDFTAGKKAKMRKRSGISIGQKYELHKIIVSDESRNLAVIKRSEIASASNYDFTLSSDWEN